MLKIRKVIRNSIAYDLGLQEGDVITAFDGYPAVDELDYFFYNAKANFTVSVQDEKNRAVLTVEKEEDEDFGVELEEQDEIRTCHNRCMFCFVDQMPKGMRESLYIKDDDYAMSFQCGNFVTLTNVSDEEIDRIIRLQLSPLYVSVQTMNPVLRCKLLGNRFAGKIVEQIKKLAEGGIKMHCQAVVVPHLSDGKELEYTARELFRYYPNVRDLAIVPTGITKFRDGLPCIDDVDKESSIRLLDLVERLNAEFGVNFLLPADEYFIRAERPFKDKAFYGDFEQIENGIGMTTKFLSEFYDALSPKKLKTPKRALCICGTSAETIMQQVCKDANEKIEGLRARPLAVVNEFFGESVTCTGLLTGKDIFNALQKESGTYDEVVLPSNTLREFTRDFLDGMTVDELMQKLDFYNVKICSGGGYETAKILAENLKEPSNANGRKSSKKSGKTVLYEKKY